MADRVGQQFGNYRLVALLGQGGFAEVYLGQHVRLNLQAAIKVLHTHLTGQEAEHFQQEAETIATLMHPAIVRILDYDVQDGVPFLVMDYAPGGSLRQRYPKGSIVPLRVVLSSVKQVAAALQYAHERKFIHRDVKPENILVGRHEELLLSDFGLAALAHGSGSLSTKEAIGTLSYMAPEQIEGHPRPASDQYALGVVVYEWLCGARPFEGSATEVMVQQLSAPPPPLREKVATVPSEVEQVVLRALAKDPKDRYASVQDFAKALEDASRLAYSPTALIPGEQSLPGSPAATAFATLAAQGETPLAPVASSASETPADPRTSPGLAGSAALAATTPAAPFLATTPAPAQVPALPRPAHPRRRTIAGLPAALLIGLAVLVVAAGVLGSLSLLAHFGVLGARSAPPALQVARGGTWSMAGDTGSLIPDTGANGEMMDALYLPLFSGDAQSVIHAAVATVVPTIGNGGVSADATTWTFHLRPGLVWSDGQPYDARDVDFTWRLWSNPKFGAYGTLGLNLISSASVSADHLSITFHLTRPFAPFLDDLWVDGGQAPLPAHHFSTMAPGQILKSQDNLNPEVVSGPFLIAESVPGNHFTLVRNPRYYQAREGLPYLDKVVFHIFSQDVLNAALQANTITSTAEQSLDLVHLQDYERLHSYTFVTPPTNVYFEALFFNFHNTVLASHLEVRQAIATAIDYQALMQAIPQGANQQCTDHSSFYHPGFDPGDPCPVFDPAAANQLLDDSGWVRDSDGVRSKGGQRLEFEYSLPISSNNDDRLTVETIIQRDLRAIGIKLDIQNYPESVFFGSFLPVGKASPPTGAIAGRDDIAEFAFNFDYDPDDSSLLACNQIPPNGFNITFYCNPALDTLYKQELATPDAGARQNIFVQIHYIYLTQFPIIVLFGKKDIYMLRKGTHNFQPEPTSAFETNNIWQWWCDHGNC